MQGILEEALKLTTDDRQKVYSHPAEDFARVVEMAGPILRSSIDPRLKHALYMIQVKIARLLVTPNHRDSLVDIAGYANTYAMVLERIAGELKSSQSENNCSQSDHTQNRYIHNFSESIQNIPNQPGLRIIFNPEDYYSYE